MVVGGRWSVAMPDGRRSSVKISEVVSRRSSVVGQDPVVGSAAEIVYLQPAFPQQSDAPHRRPTT